ncbi:FecR family protein [Pedobacter sp.]|jgi:transmembrane sensor|uniref:FecR family protein n=1 Tax=Pedobacter sp. TaxID=1411316 RepID=UPI002C083F4A|nr:FecR domain-containing protein [Pedobacter sp.]HWW37874.1 FecR domain-containing protein [Pedobacter sp.]
MTTEEVEDILKRYSEGNCTPEEQLWVHSWNNQRHAQANDNDPAPTIDLQKRIWAKANGLEHKTFKLKPAHKWACAAAIALVLATSAIYFSHHKTTSSTYATVKDIPPGTNRAILTLASGKQIALDSSQKVYTVVQTPGISAINTITTPKGGQYQVILPDGSKVYLNAASSLKYPVNFTGTERRVTLTGEAYFEITKNPSHPFIVTCLQQSVKVLGTHFNVSSYPDEPTKTTLAEGSVQILTTTGVKKAILKPGQQSTVSASDLQVNSVNAADVIAWTDGLFVFTKTSLKSVLTQVARWYDVEVDYDKLPDQNFEGEISRKVSLQEVLKAIEQGSDVKLKLEGRRIMIRS